MQTFLQKTAQYIFEKHPLNDLSRICVVIPSRRGVLYFKQALAKLSDKPFLAPEVLAIDDFVAKITGVKQIDQMSLLFELYDVFKEIDPLVNFERFMTWAPTLLNDFDKIDQYLVEPKALFSYMSEAKSLERWQMQMGESQRDKLKKTDKTDRYFKLFENINTVYENLRKNLTERGLVYRGMAYRTLAENVDQYLVQKEPYKKYYIVGFNALSDAEEKIFKTLIKNKLKAETIWDSDTYYLRTKDQRAGEWLRKYKESGVFGEWQWESEELLKSQKNIQIIGVANASMQAKVAGHIYRNWRKEQTEVVSQNSTIAIVLGDENLLTPVMNSVDEPSLNITMGLSLKSSMLFTLIDALFELQRNLVEFKNAEGEIIRIPKFSHRHVVKVLNHPFVRRYFVEGGNLTPEASVAEAPFQQETELKVNILQGEEILRFTLNEITQKNKVFLGANELIEMGQNDPLYDILFTHWKRNPKKALKSFYALIDIFREIYRTSQDAIETEYLYRFYLILQRLEGILDERKDSISFRSFKTFLYELIKQEKIPFESETNEQLQIMGMLETRTLDFEKIIILSVNEGTLPQGKSQNSLVPFDAFKEFGLPTHNHADAVMSYHFFRLLQRAKEVVLLHVLPSDTYGGGEKSRFILQIEHELKKINTNLNVTYPTISFKSQMTEDETEAKLEIHKTPEIVDIIEKRITEKGLYPSHLNEFISCSIKYYFSQIAGIAEAEEVSEKIEADTFGNWLHKTLENIDNELMKSNKPIQKEHLQAVFEKLDTYLDAAFAETNRGLRRDEGQNYITYQVGRKLLKKFFSFQLQHESFPVELLGTEKAFNVSFPTQIEGKELKIKVAGRIDRLDRIEGNKIRVVDYKTGKVELKDLKPSKEQTTQDALMDKDKEKYRQLWLYKYILLKKMESNDIVIGNDIVLKANENQVMAGIYSFRNIEAGFLTQDVAFTMGESVQEFLQESENQLVAFASDMLDTSKTFERTNDLETCVYCDFKGICGR
jgi:PD-(D/E)XK nuclease superfamily